MESVLPSPALGGNGGLHYLPLAVEALHTQVDLVTQTGVAQQQLMGVLVEELAARGTSPASPRGTSAPTQQSLHQCR